MKANAMSEAIIKQEVQRKWMPYRVAAQCYVGVDKTLLLGAIKRKELKAFEKPITKTHTTDDPKKQRKSYFVNTDDVDEWIRSHWEPAFADS